MIGVNSSHTCLSEEVLKGSGYLWLLTVCVCVCVVSWCVRILLGNTCVCVCADTAVLKL